MTWLFFIEFKGCICIRQDSSNQQCYPNLFFKHGPFTAILTNVFVLLLLCIHQSSLYWKINSDLGLWYRIHLTMSGIRTHNVRFRHGYTTFIPIITSVVLKRCNCVFCSSSELRFIMINQVFKGRNVCLHKNRTTCHYSSCAALFHFIFFFYIKLDKILSAYQMNSIYILLPK